MAERTTERRPAAPAREASSGPGVSGPAQRKLTQLAAVIGKAPAAQRLHATAATLAVNPARIVQRRIRNRMIAPGNFVYESAGRAGRHNTAVNRNALAELRGHRAAFPSDAGRHANNEAEQAVATGAATIAGLGLHMAHHVSDAVVQAAIVTAANAHNGGAPAAGAWAPLVAMIAGIVPPGGAPAAALPLFTAAATAAHNRAHGVLLAALALPAIPHTAFWAGELTAMANAIANSPMNLHHGDGATNMSIGHHGDPNSYPRAPGLVRRLSWRSHQMRAATAGLGPNPLHDRTLAAASFAPPGSVAHGQAFAFAAAVPGAAAAAGNYVHSSGTPRHFVIPG